MPKHSDFQEIYDAMQEQYGDTVEEVYNAWLNKHGYDDTKSLDSQKSVVRHLEFDKLFRELFRRLRAAALGFYENWLQDQELDETFAISLQKSGFLKGGGRLYFTKANELHVHTDNMFSGSFEKIDGPDDEVIVAGYASTCVEDTWGDKFTPDMIREGAEKYMETPIVFYCHYRSEPAGLILEDYTNPAGKVFKTKLDEVGWYVVSKPSNALRNVKGLIQEGLLKAYSIGGYYIFDRVGGLVGTTIHDVSYVPRPANKLSYHGIVSQRIGIQRGEGKKLEKEEIQTLLDAHMKEVNDGLEAFKADVIEKMKALEGIDSVAINATLDDLGKMVQDLKSLDFAGLDTRMVALEGLKEQIDAGVTALEPIVERLDAVEGFNKAFGEDFDYAKLEERIVSIEDMPLVKGVITLPPAGMADVHKKIGEFNSFEDGARFIRGLQTQ